MKIPLRERGKCTKRTLENMATDRMRFQLVHDSDVKYAKDYNNVIDEPLFNIPIDQVLYIIRVLLYKNSEFI